MNRNRKAFLDMIAWSEIGPRLLAVSDNGYDVIVGSTPERPILFEGYADHPRRKIAEENDSWDRDGKVDYSTAAGRYQILARYYDHYRQQLGLPDFSPASQDAGNMWLYSSFDVINKAAGDSLVVTWTLTFGS